MQNTKSRTSSCSFSVLSKSDGSAKFSQGDTSVIGNASGPYEQKNVKETVDKMSISVSLKSKTGSPSANHKFIEKTIQELCESAILTKTYACKTSISVVLQEIYDDGSFLACCVNAACASLLDACVNLRFQFAAVNAAIFPQNIIIIDSTKSQESEAKGLITFIYNKELQLLAIFSRGLYSRKEYDECLERSKTYISTIFQMFSSSIAS